MTAPLDFPPLPVGLELEALERRFWSKVTIAGPDECWLWTAGVNRHGRGRFWFAGRKRFAYRIAWALIVGPVPAGLVLDHVRCGEPRCVNPRHLEPVTHAVNAQRALTGVPLAPGHRARIAAAQEPRRGVPRTAEERAHIRAALASADVRARISAGTRTGIARRRAA